MNYHARHSTASGAYIRTDAPKFSNLANADADDDDRRRLIGPLSSASFKSPNMQDDRSLGFPATPSSAAFEQDRNHNPDTKSANTELGRLSPLYQSGGDLGTEQLSYLSSETAYKGT
jgi:hypothetical protein